MDNQQLTIGQKLKKFLRSEGISQEDAAKALGISRPTLSEYFKRADLDPSFLQTVKYTYPIFLQLDKLDNLVNGESASKSEDVSEPDTPYPKKPDPLQDQADYREKYYAVLEQQQGLLITINKTAQAAIDAAQAATKVAEQVTSQLQNHEARLVASETMLMGIQEFVTVRFAQNENISRQKVGAALGKTVMDIANQKKKGIQTEVDT